jgi:hypothetical protein
LREGKLGSAWENPLIHHRIKPHFGRLTSLSSGDDPDMESIDRDEDTELERFIRVGVNGAASDDAGIISKV